MNPLSENRELLIIKNISREGPGLLGDIIAEHGIKHKVVDLSLGDKTNSIENYRAVVVLGGPDSANDSTGKMKGELAMISSVLDARIPYLGICLGLQTLVKAAGGLVVKSPLKETGFREENGDYFKISLTEEGRKDPLFEGIDGSFNVFHLHGETVVLAGGMKLLATGKSCINQIVRIGSNAYGIQSHVELTEEMFETWISEDPELRELKTAELRSDFMESKIEINKTGNQLFLNFLRLARLI
jgi:GMP synthase (glutamine-hydrolysing)